MNNKKRVAVIGAGIGGISAAYRLQQQGYQVQVYEAADFIGGRMKSIDKNGFTIDVGAGILPGAYVDTKALMNEAGLNHLKEEVQGNCAFMRDGKAYMIDISRMQSGLARTSLLGWKTKFALLKLVIKLVCNQHKLTFHTMGLGETLDTESVTQYCRRELPGEALDYLLGPFVRTMFLHAPEHASIAELLWCMKNLTGSMFSLRGGMGSLAKTLAQSLTVHLNTQVQRVEELAAGVAVTLRDAAGRTYSDDVDYCIIATDAPALLSLYGHGLTAVQNRYLSEQQYSTDVVVSFALAEPPAIDAALVQVPAPMDKELVALVIDNKKGSGRVPAGKGMVTGHFLSSWGEQMAAKSDAEIIADATERVAKIIPEVGNSLEFAHIERWQKAATMFDVGGFRQQAAFMNDIKQDARVQYCGDYMALSSVNVSVATAKVAVANIRRQA